MEQLTNATLPPQREDLSEFYIISGNFEMGGANFDLIITIVKSKQLAEIYANKHQQEYKHIIRVVPVLPSVGGYWLIVAEEREQSELVWEHKFNLVGDEVLAQRLAEGYQLQLPHLPVKVRALHTKDFLESELSPNVNLSVH